MSSTPSAFEVAAAPALIAGLQAVQAFIKNIGTDPTKWAITVPGALTVLVGSLQLQLPVLAASEATALQSALDAQIAKQIASLQAAQAAAAAPAATTAGVTG